MKKTVYKTTLLSLLGISKKTLEGMMKAGVFTNYYKMKNITIFPLESLKQDLIKAGFYKEGEEDKIEKEIEEIANKNKRRIKAYKDLMKKEEGNINKQRKKEVNKMV